MARKIIIDCDPGIDDALAICIALWDPRIEVLAITACAGTVDANQASDNLSTLVEKFDPPMFPRLGAASDPEQGAAVFNGALLHGDNGLGNTHWQSISRQHSISSDKMIIDQLRAYPGEVTVVCTGPLTNLAKALGRDPAIVSMIDRVVIAGGTLRGVGDVTPCAEFNFHFDPGSAQAVLHSATTKTLIPLEVSNRLSFGWEMVEKLPPKYAKAGSVLHELIPHFFRSTRQHLGHETVSFQAVAAILSILDPTLMTFEEMAGDVETAGELTRGALILDHRDPRVWRINMEVATLIDADEARLAFYQSLSNVG
jgi:inosine-uridine nucleoside N-ribohydrolase